MDTSEAVLLAFFIFGGFFFLLGLFKFLLELFRGDYGDDAVDDEDDDWKGGRP